MVVLLDIGDSDPSCKTMLGSGPNQYIQPDYLGPLPSTLDAKQSPLALLAQTCSQIGADNNSTPPKGSLLEKRKTSTCSDTSDNRDTSSQTRPKSSSSTTSKDSSSSSKVIVTSNGKLSPETQSKGGESISHHHKVLKSPQSLGSCSSSSSTAFRPYSNCNSDKDKDKEKDKTSHKRLESKSPSPEKVGEKRSSQGPSSSDSSSSCNNKKSKHEESNSTISKSRSSPTGSGSKDKDKDRDRDAAGTSPIIRSGLEVLQGNDYRTPKSFPYPFPYGGVGVGFDPTNPAFRPPHTLFPHLNGHGHHGHPHPHHPHLGPFPGSPYIGYSRVKTASGSESIIPVCKDPYCTGCQFSAASASALMAAAAGLTPGGSSGCALGCVHACDHPKGFNVPNPFFPPGLGGYPPPPGLQIQPPSTSALSTLASQAQQQRPYVCNWIVGDSYCGKRFGSSEELLQHLRTHPTQQSTSTTNSNDALTAALMQQQAAAYSSLLRPYPTPPISPLDSSGRYNPYAAAAMNMAMKGLGVFPPPQGLPPQGSVSAASLASLYSNPYASIYGQKVHP